MTDFARPASQLADSGIANAAAPTGGKGLVLDPTGLLPPSVHPPILTTWPAAAVPSAEILPGYEFYYVADSTNGVYWHFKYDPTQATYPWVFLGGAALQAEVDTGETRANTAYGDLATAGPSITLPRTGDYTLAYGADATSSVAADGSKLSPSINGGAPADADVALLIGGGATVRASLARTRRKTGISGVVKLQYATITGGTGTWNSRFLSVLPIRLA